MKHPIKKESNFVKELGRALSSDLTEEEKMILDVRYGLDYGGVANFANIYLGKLIKAIKKHLMSLEGFGPQDDEVFSILLNSDRLDRSLQRELSSLLYDPKMREKYFKWISMLAPYSTIAKFMRLVCPTAFSYLSLFFSDLFSFGLFSFGLFSS